MRTERKARLRLGRGSHVELPKVQSRAQAMAQARANAKKKAKSGLSPSGQERGARRLGIRRAVIVGPRIGSAREFARAFFEVGVDPQELARDLRVAVDGGLKVFRQIGWKPHFAVGDWDSLKPEKVSTALKGIFHLTLPRKKDRSDLYYACRAAISAGADELLCVGVTGGRPDHQLATLMDLAEISSLAHGPRAVIAADGDVQYYFLSQYCPFWEAHLRPGQTVSVFALTDQVMGVTLEGFRFPLKNAVLKPSSHGLSNEVEKGPVSVRVRTGRLVVMVLTETV